MSSSSALWPLVATRPLPRLHVLSDLHLESGPYEIPSGLEYDVLVAAGDIGPVELAVPWLASLGKPVVYVLGNHEYWGMEFLEAAEHAKALAHGTQVRVLERDSAVIEGVRFLGCTLWTDLKGFQQEFVSAAGRCMRDYLNVTCEKWLASPTLYKKLEALCRRHQFGMPSPDEQGRLRLHPGITYLEHMASRKWLKHQLENKFDGPTVVVTHHAPSHESLLRNGMTAAQLKAARWSFHDSEPARIAAYASEGVLREVGGERALLWVHGHIHTGMDYLEESTRVVCNPRGRLMKPLAETDIQSYALFGIRLTSEDVQRSQEVFAEDPFHGEGRDFDKRLVVDFEHLMNRPLALACEAPAQRMHDLAGEIENLTAHVGAGQSVSERCVAECMQQRLDKLTEELDQLKKMLLSQLDRYWSTTVLQTIGTPHIPGLWDPFEDGWQVSGQDIERLRRDLALLLAWVDDLPSLPERSLEACRQVAAQAIKAAKDAGFELRLRRFPVKALKRVDARELRFVAANEAALTPDPAHRLDLLLDKALNAHQLPRRWLFRVEEPHAGQRFIARRHLSIR